MPNKIKKPYPTDYKSNDRSPQIKDRTLPLNVILDITSARLVAAEEELNTLNESLVMERQSVSLLKARLLELENNNNNSRVFPSATNNSTKPALSGGEDALSEFRFESLITFTKKNKIIKNYLLFPNKPSNITGDFDSHTEADWEAAQKIDFSTVIARYVAKVNPSSEFQGTTAQLMKPLVNKFNDLKKSASAEIQRLNQKCKIIQSSSKEEISRLKSSLTDSKEQINSLREENNRKIKLINSFKTVKNSEDNSLEQVSTKLIFIIIIFPLKYK